MQWSNVTSDGRCCACGEQLICVDIDRAETEHFAQSVASLAMEREVQFNFKEFQVSKVQPVVPFSTSRDIFFFF